MDRPDANGHVWNQQADLIPYAGMIRIRFKELALTPLSRTIRARHLHEWNET
jgi:hypothetical protein